MALKQKYLVTATVSGLMVLFLIGYNNYAQSPKEELLDKVTVSNQSPDPLEYLKSGFNYLQKNNFDEAEASCEKAISLIPNPITQTDKDNLIKAHDLLAIIYGKQNKIDMAIDEYRKALNFNPNSDSIYYKLAVLYATEGMNNDAKDAFQKVIEIGDKGESKGVLAAYAKQALERMQNR